MRRMIGFAIVWIVFLCMNHASGSCKASTPGHLLYEDTIAADTISINFHQSKWNLDMNMGLNANALDRFKRRFRILAGDSLIRLRRVSVLGAASPEGSVEFNRVLSQRRAATLFGWVKDLGLGNDIEKSFIYLGRDWEGVLRFAENDTALPFRNETLSLLRDIAKEKGASGGAEPRRSLERIKNLKGGAPYSYLYRNIFPLVRASRLVLCYENLPSQHIVVVPVDSITPSISEVVFDNPVSDADTVSMGAINIIAPRKPFYMAVRTNMLYDLLLLPNIGVDFYLGKGLTIGVNWMYGWWSRDTSHWFWRAYGGELNCRWYPWHQDKYETPFSGHHFGLLGQVYIYDFEFGRKGEMGGTPGGTILDKPFWSAGVEYGYTLPIASRLSLDFSIGVGYATGLYHTYNPRDTHYVWEGTRRRRYFGPTKAEVSLVWLIGRGNTNKRKDNGISDSAGKGGGR